MGARCHACVRDSGPTCRTLTCASGHHCETVNGTGTCVADAGGAGATCGGIAALRCGTGFQCVMTSHLPDATGVCHPESTLGGRCNGTTLYAPVCAAGLTCDGPEAGSPPGASGLCIR